MKLEPIYITYHVAGFEAALMGSYLVAKEFADLLRLHGRCGIVEGAGWRGLRLPDEI